VRVVTRRDGVQHETVADTMVVALAVSDRDGRVQLVGEAADSLLALKMPSVPAALFLGGALKTWLELGGNLERDYLQVTQRGSHRTPSRIWSGLIDDEGHGDTDGNSVGPSKPKNEPT
jgi:hypothetical protein